MDAAMDNKALEALAGRVGEAPDAVLDDDDRAVDDDAEVECTKTHQIRADLV